PLPVPSNAASSSFFAPLSCHHLDLHSFPTRRSSDLPQQFLLHFHLHLRSPPASHIHTLHGTLGLAFSLQVDPSLPNILRKIPVLPVLPESPLPSLYLTIHMLVLSPHQ